jgi:hypothetical protein
VEISTCAGATYVCEKRDAKGSGARPFSFAEISDKFIDLAKPVLGADGALAMVDAISKLEDLENVRGLTTLLR